MKKILKSIAALALVALAASCAKEQVIAPEGEESLVSFTVATPELMTKAVADGNTVDKVDCYVYDETGAVVTQASKTVAMSAGKATFQAKLLTGKTYSFIFWAYNSSATCYTFDSSAKTVKVNSYATDSNDEKRDAFYAYMAPEKISSATVNKTVTLYRPFAQVNLGVSEADVTSAKAFGISFDKSSAKFTGLANVLNLVDGTVSGSEDASFAAAAVLSEKLTVNKTDYVYLSMDYILVGKAEKSLTDAEFNIYNGSDLVTTVSVPNVPVQGNYRTNILANRLFTSDVNVNIVVDPAFEKPDYEVEIWDGATVNEPSTDANGNYLITKASELAWVAQKTNSGTNFKGKTITLQNDIDLRNNEWTPIGTSANPFKGLLDGQNYKISNLAIHSSANTEGLGLFGYVYGDNPGDPIGIQNLTIDGAEVISEVSSAGCGVAAGVFSGHAVADNVKVVNATVKNTHYVGGIAGYAYGYFRNCTVDKAELTAVTELTSTGYDNGDKVGGIVGFWGEGSGRDITSCKATDVKIKGYRDLGGIVGIVQGTTTVKDNTVESVTITVDKTHDYKGYGTDNTKYNAGSIMGRHDSWTGTESGNTGTAKIEY